MFFFRLEGDVVSNDDKWTSGLIDVLDSHTRDLPDVMSVIR